MNQLKQLYLKHRERGQLNFDLKSLYEKRFINSSNHLNSIIVYTTSLYVENNSPREQTLYTTGFKRIISKTNEVNFTRTFGFSLSAGVEIMVPFKKLIIGAGIKYEENFSEHESVRILITENEIVIAPKEPINVNPYSRVKVTYNVYQYIDILNYYLDFEVVPHAKDLFAFFLKKLGNAVYGQGDLKLEYLDGKPILRNFLEIENLPSLGVNVTIDSEEKIPKHDNIKVIQIS